MICGRGERLFQDSGGLVGRGGLRCWSCQVVEGTEDQARVALVRVVVVVLVRVFGWVERRFWVAAGVAAGVAEGRVVLAVVERSAVERGVAAKSWEETWMALLLEISQ